MRSRSTPGTGAGRAVRALVALAAVGAAALLGAAGPVRADGPAESGVDAGTRSAADAGTAPATDAATDADRRLGVPIDRARVPGLGAALPSSTLRPSANTADGAPATLSLPTDRDRDGVLDAEDACPGSGRGVRVGPDGCLVLDPASTRVTFAPGSAWLSPAAGRRLGEALAALERFPAKRLEVAGRARVPGAGDRGLSLALRRAEAVVDWFVGRGVPASRIDVIAVARVAGRGRAGDDAASRIVELRLLH